MKIDVIVGGLYGDEGKGKIVSKLGKDYDYVFRVNASTNASHTVVSNNGEKYVTKQLPSVFGNNKTKFVIAPGAILNLHALREELESRNDIEYIKDKIVVATSISLLITPYIEINKNEDGAKKYGSTNQGTGFAVVARSAKHSIKLFDVEAVIKGNKNLNYLIDKVKETCLKTDYNFFQNKETSYYEKEAELLIEDYNAIFNLLGNFTKDYSEFLYKIKDKKVNILIEGCNGVMLDTLHGLNPYTTSASTSLNALMNGANLSPYFLNDTFVIITGYFCCLNKRPFLTEMDDENAKLVFRYNSEVDDAENMKRRIGWFDLPTLKKSLLGHKKCKLILNKLDIMQDFKEIKVCDYYINDANEKVNIMPDDVEELIKLKPHYIIFKGWGKLNEITKDNIPITLDKFVKYIEKETNEEVFYLGTGRKENDLIKIK